MDSSSDAVTVTRRLTQLKHMRRGKKSAITKRISQLENLILEGSKKRMLQILSDNLQTVMGELVQVCEEIAAISPENELDQYNDLEDVRSNVELCIAAVTDHLDSRRDEGTSSGSISDWVQRHSLGSYKGGSDVESKSRASVDVAGEAGVQFQASKVGESYIDYSSITEPRSPHIDSSPSPRVSLTDSKIISEISISQNITPVPTPRPPPNNIEFQGVDNLDTVAITQAGSVHHDCHGNNEMVAQKLMSALDKSGSDDLDTTITNHDDNLLMDNDGNYLVDGGDLNQTVPTRTAISGNTLISVEKSSVQYENNCPTYVSNSFERLYQCEDRYKSSERPPP